jgi:DNA-binding transcriptional LysR family regulator
MPDRKRTATLDWEDVRYFVALAQHGSLSSTARKLGVNHATVARRVTSFEGAIGRSLFDRRAGGYILNLEGKAVLDEALAMDQAALAVSHRLNAGTELSGSVRLTTLRSLADHFLIDRLDDLHKRYPALDLEVIVEARVMSLARREADLALRLGRPKDSELIARRVGSIEFAFYASPACRRKLTSGAPPLLIGYDEDSDFVPEAVWLNRRFSDQRFAFRANTHTSQAAAARASFGVALLPRFLAAPDPGLVEITFGELPPTRGVWLLMRPDLAKVPRVRIVVDYIADLFRRERGFFEGSAGKAGKRRAPRPDRKRVSP